MGVIDVGRWELGFRGWGGATAGVIAGRVKAVPLLFVGKSRSLIALVSAFFFVSITIPYDAIILASVFVDSETSKKAAAPWCVFVHSSSEWRSAKHKLNFLDHANSLNFPSTYNYWVIHNYSINLTPVDESSIYII